MNLEQSCNKEAEMSTGYENLQKKLNEFKERHCAIPKQDEGINLEELFQKAKYDLEDGAENAYKKELEKRAALVKNTDANSEINISEIGHSIIKDFFNEAKNKSDQLNTAVNTIKDKYEKMDEKVENYEDLITDVLVYYENLQEQRINKAQEIYELRKSMRGLQKQKGRNPLDAEITCALNTVIKEYKFEMRELRREDKLKDSSEIFMRNLHKGFIISISSKDICRGIINSGKETCKFAEIYLNRIDNIIQSWRENLSIREPLWTYKNLEEFEKEIFEKCDFLFDYFNKFFEQTKKAESEFKKGLSLLDMGVRDGPYPPQRYSAYECLKAIIDI